MSSSLKYRIQSITSEHPKHPASNLYSSAGWQSSISPLYPQQITIHFYVPIRTKQLKLLFHNYKIPKSVEVFTKFIDSKYQKLGNVYPNENKHSNYQQQQIKTLYFEYRCSHLRLVLHEPFKNEMNVLNQVALGDIRVEGEIVGVDELRGIDLAVADTSSDEEMEYQHQRHQESYNASNTKSLEQASSINATDYDTQNSMSQVFTQIYRKLQQKKQEAVQDENYQAASHFKTILANFKQQEMQISKLERQKVEALKKQDFDRCQKIKQELNRKKQMVEHQKNELFRNQVNFVSQNSYSRVVEDLEESFRAEKERDRVRDIREEKPQNISQMASPIATIDYESQIVPALRKKMMGENGETQRQRQLPLSTNEKPRKVSAYDSAYPQNVSLHDLKQNSPKKDQQTARKAPQPLDIKDRLNLSNYFSFIEEPIWEKIYSTNWTYKLEAIRECSCLVEKVKTKQQYMGLIEMIAKVLPTPQAIPKTETLQMLLSLTQMPIGFTHHHLPYFVDYILSELLSMLNDTNTKLKELSYLTYFNLPKIQFLSMNTIVQKLILHKKNQKTDAKLYIIKLNLMKDLVENYECDGLFRDIMSWAINCVEDQHQSVRKSATELLVVMSGVYGIDKISGAISDKSHVFDLFTAALNASQVEESMQMQIQENRSKRHHKQQQKRSPRPPSQNIDLSYSKESIYQQSFQKYNQQQSFQKYNQQPQDGENQIHVLQPQNVCDYCFQQYSCEEKEHYVKECRTIICCQYCRSCIYIREMTLHLLTQCPEKHRGCTRCGLAFEMDEINQHVGRGGCRLRREEEWERCQLCGVDVMADDGEWVKHAQNCKDLPPKLPVQEYSSSSLSMQYQQ